MELMRRARSRRNERRIAALTAALILFVQVLAAAHIHSFPSSREYLTKAAVSVDDGLCAICLLRFHSPIVFVALPAPRAPLIVKPIVVQTIASAPLVAFSSHIFGRAPPASV
jgi:hypothetical protein